VAEPDAVMVRISEGIALRQAGEHAAARDLFAQVWSEIGGERGDPFHRCALAHSMADVQDDVHEELLWDCGPTGLTASGSSYGPRTRPAERSGAADVTRTRTGRSLGGADRTDRACVRGSLRVAGPRLPMSLLGSGQ
jgi:hypothetical protein